MKALTLVILAFLVGCATTAGSKIDESYISSLEPGVTTISQVKSELGDPDSLTKNSKGEISMTWGYARVSGLGSIESEGVSITFDSKGMLKDFTYHAYDP